MLLGLNLSHDSSAALVDNFGVVLAAVSEERITRKKNIISFPRLQFLIFPKSLWLLLVVTLTLSLQI